MNEHERMFYILDGGKVITPKEFEEKNIIICKVVTPKQGYTKDNVQDVISSAIDLVFNKEEGSY
jgi:hypothetical protein